MKEYNIYVDVNPEDNTEKLRKSCFLKIMKDYEKPGKDEIEKLVKNIISKPNIKKGFEEKLSEFLRSELHNKVIYNSKYDDMLITFHIDTSKKTAVYFGKKNPEEENIVQKQYNEIIEKIKDDESFKKIKIIKICDFAISEQFSECIEHAGVKDQFNKLVSGINVGLEIEFCWEYWKYKKLESLNLEDIEKLYKLINDWYSKLPSIHLEKSKFEARKLWDEIKIIQGKDGKTTKAGEIKGSPLLTVCYGDNNSKLEWSVTVDEGTIEIIINRAPLHLYEEHSKKLQNDIYQIAKTLELEIMGKIINDNEEPEKERNFSMTHINIDFKTGFIENFYLVLLKHFFLEASQLVDKSPFKDTKYSMYTIVKQNAPYISEMLYDNNDKTSYLRNMNELLMEKQKVDYKVLSCILGDNLGNEKDENNKLHNLCKKIYDNFKGFTNGIQEVSRAKEIISSPLHYRAINIEHLESENSSDRRIEFRRNIGTQNFTSKNQDKETEFSRLNRLCTIIVKLNLLYLINFGNDK